MYGLITVIQLTTNRTNCLIANDRAGNWLCLTARLRERIPGCRDSKNVVSEDLDWSVQLAISYKLSPFRAELLTNNYINFP
jgi:hypothetical protein